MKKFDSLNRKLHIHVGLFLLLFIWLFAFSGLLLNHHWKFASFWDQRQQVEFTTNVHLPVSPDSASLIQSVMKELSISGEVTNVKYSVNAIDFRVNAPGTGKEFHVDVATGIVTRKEYELNVWGKIMTLHKFNGVDKSNVAREATWAITGIWKFSMDGIAILLIFLCVSSWIMWYKMRREYRWGLTVLVTAFLVSFYFVYLVRMF